MIIFRYIEDKDVFQKFYSRMLARRLVHTSSASDDAETSMISKLKEACGFEFTNKLQRMFQDIQVSKDLNSNYKLWLSENTDSEKFNKTVDTYFNILSTGFWPLFPPATPFIAPPTLVKTYEQFQKFYIEKHNGRRLTWLWNLCKGDVKANYCKAAKTPYVFQVSTFQMAILLLFNEKDTVSYNDMRDATSLNEESLDPSLAIFVKAKVLTVSPDSTKYGPDTKFSLNFDFKSKKLRVNLNMVVKSEAKAEVEDTHKTIEEDRKLLMQVSSLLDHHTLILVLTLA
jgi:cullin 1